MGSKIGNNQALILRIKGHLDGDDIDSETRQALEEGLTSILEDDDDCPTDDEWSEWVNEKAGVA
mgnify:CR=1 FL=1